jgi:hypothetical protein
MLVGKHFHVGEAAGVIHTDMDVLPAGTSKPDGRVSVDAVPDPTDSA